jgi:F0F1-type ATP synthase assembly protein I
MTDNPKNDSKKSKSPLSDYARYSSLAFQMIAIILVGVFGGIELDKLVKMKFPVFTVVLTILAVIASMYYAVKDLIKKK